MDKAIVAVSSKKTLLVFARKPRPGAVKTRLTPPLSPEEAAELYRCMIQDTLASQGNVAGVETVICFEEGPGAQDYFAALATGLPLRAQEGEGLTERLTAAFAAAFRDGAASVAAIGSDAPDLPPELIAEAFQRLESAQADVVFGPTGDGGYYLVALGKFHPALFADIPWSTDQVLVNSLARAAEAGLRTALLPPWHDIDTVEDLRSFAARPAGTAGRLTRAFIRDHALHERGLTR